MGFQTREGTYGAVLGIISQALIRRAHGWLILLLLGVQVPFNAFIFPDHRDYLVTQGGYGSIDALIAYTPALVYRMISSYGEAGRASYRLFELTVDLIYPVLYSLFLALSITWLFQRGFEGNEKVRMLNLVPLGGWLSDLLENLGIVAMISIHPATPETLGWLTSGFTLLKWSFAAASLLLLLIGGVAAIHRGFGRAG